MVENLSMEEKLAQLSPELRKMIQTQAERDKEIDHWLSFCSQKPDRGVVTDFLGKTLLHCNAGATMDVAFWLKEHLANGGKLVVTIAGALSSFQVGVLLSELIRQGKVHLVSATGANHEESYYRYVAHSKYAYIKKYTELTPQQEAELRDAGLRRITDTFLPEDDSVRLLEPPISSMIENEAKNLKVTNDPEVGLVLTGGRYFPHEYFRRLFEKNLIQPDPTGNPEHCWVYACHQKNIPIVIPGFEDSTMGNILSGYTYAGINKNVEKRRSFSIKSLYYKNWS